MIPAQLLPFTQTAEVYTKEELRDSEESFMSAPSFLMVGARATPLTSESERQSGRQSSGRLPSGNAAARGLLRDGFGVLLFDLFNY